MRNIFNTLLVGTLLWFSLPVKSACIASPDCVGLGYDKTSDQCPDGYVKCPWDVSKVFCGKGRGCVAGDIYFTDNSCGRELIDGKTPLGIVGHVNSDDTGGVIVSFEGTSGIWDNAKKFCDSYSYNGFSGWELPKPADLMNTLGYNCYHVYLTQDKVRSVLSLSSRLACGQAFWSSQVSHFRDYSTASIINTNYGKVQQSSAMVNDTATCYAYCVRKFNY